MKSPFRALSFAALSSFGLAQQPTAPPAVVSPEVRADRHVTFRINAPMAQNVRLTESDIPGLLQGAPMTKGENGVWEITLGPIDPGAYRYNFNVDRVSVIDPRHPSISESNNNGWSMVYIPGADFMDTKEVPHGAVSAVTYYSSVLKQFRRDACLHAARVRKRIWQISGVLSAAWRRGLRRIVDFCGARRVHHRQPGRGVLGQDGYVDEFSADIMPYAEGHYRIEKNKQHRAIAGLSMGGTQTLNIAIPHLDQFACIGVFSSGLIGVLLPESAATSATPTTTWEEQHRAQLDNPATKKGLKLVWFSTGSDNRLITTSRSTVDLLKEFAPLVFQ